MPGDGEQEFRPLTTDNRRKSQELWGRLRKDYRFIIIQMRRAELQPSVLVHGVKLLRQVAVPVPLLGVAHACEQRSLVSLDCAGTVRLHHEDGRLRGSRQLQWPVSGLLYVGRIQQYVAWNQQELLLLDGSFLLLSRQPVQQGVSSCVYHPIMNLVLTAGAGGVNVWSFSRSRRILVQHQYLRLGTTEEDTVAALATDTESPHVHTCYAACGTSVWEYDLVDGTLKSVRRHLHARAISSLLYSAPLHFLISGSRDGSIKVWDSSEQLVAVFVGHTGPVTVLSLISSGTVLVSGSKDASLRTWDLTTQEQMEEQRMSGPVLGLVAFFSNEDHIVTHGRNELHVWQLQHLYQLHCSLGTPVTTVIVSEALAPSRTLCVCADGTVRLLCTSTGRLMTMLDVGERLLAAEFCPLQEMVCALLEDGHLLKASVLTNPMRVVSRMKVSGSKSNSCCFCLFSYIADKKAAETDNTAAGTLQREGFKEKDITRHRFFCIIGSDNGHLRVYNLHSDQLQCDTEAHSPGRVTGLMSIPENQYIISAGSDLTVKVWQLYPYSEESLGLCMSFYCAQPIARMCCLHSQLFVAFDDDSSATYTLVQYCLETGIRSDHSSSHDHQDQITGLCSSPDLGLVVSCGRDKMIRIWTEENRLLRLLRLHASPESLSLCSSRGDLLVGIHGHIYRISLIALLPEPYKMKIMCMVSPTAAPDSPTAAPDSPTAAPDSPTAAPDPPSPVEDMKRLGHMHRSSNDSCNESKKKTKQQHEECSLLSTRDQELHLIQMGKLRSFKRMKSSKETRREAMEKYLQLMYPEKPGFTIPEQDDFDPDELLKTSVFQEPKIIPFTPPQNSHGFFTDSALGLAIDLIPKHLQTLFLVAGVVPNSALLQQIWPTKIEEELGLVKRRNHLQPIHTQPAKTSHKTPEMEKEKKNADPQETTEVIAEEMSEVDEVPPILQNILSTVNTKDKSPVVHDTRPPLLQSPLTQKQARSTMLQKTRMSRIPRPQPIQTKTFQEPFLPVQLPPQSPPLCPPAVKACSTASTSLQDDELSVKIPEMVPVPEIPAFLLQFQDQSWFSLILPEAEASYPEFESRLLRALLQTGLPMCTQLLHALQTLHRQGHLKYPERLLQTLTDVIKRETDLTVCEQQEFVWLCLHFMNDLSRESRELMVELLVTCTQLPAPHRGRFFALFNEFGVHDPHGFLAKKCSSWDSWDETGNGREGLKKICEDWLCLWTFRLMGGNRSRREKPQERLEDHVTAVDVLNYYCDIQMKRELQVLHVCDPGRRSTVLALPPISSRRALLRLGETGKQESKRGHEGGNFDAVRPLLRSDIIPFINLPVKKVTLNPFISTTNTPTRGYSTGSLSQDIQRYFIVQQSYIERY
ncbi:WD repeat-containing protein 97 isoform X2 [Ranitomeya variabilis]|uniref:WD repeat-containing protein 97 isoform X2 n=1 Tax=Ranitomeya variabilis TaxID=490064 RepID=UPI004057AF3C